MNAGFRRIYIFPGVVAFFFFIVVGFVSLSTRGTDWPDEIFQTIEVSNFLLFGKGILSWEFPAMARTVVYPYILSPFIKFFYIFSDSTQLLYTLNRLFLGGILSCVVFYSLCKIAVKTEFVFFNSIIFITTFSFNPVIHYFGYRNLTDSIALISMIPAIFLLYNKEVKDRNSFLGGFLLSLTFGIRFQSALFTVVYLPAWYLIYKPEKKETFRLFIGLVLGFVLYLLSDLAFYGIPGISSVNYFRETIILDKGSQWGVYPFIHYFQRIQKFFGFFWIFTLLGIYFYGKKMVPIVLGLLSFLLIHSLIGHKEDRFITPIYYFLAFFGASGILGLFAGLHKNSKYLGILLLLLTIPFLLSHYYKVATVRLDWNREKVKLDIAMEINKQKINGNILFSTTDIFAWGTGYSYLGKNFTSDIYFLDLDKNDKFVFQEIISKNKIRYILAYTSKEKVLCKEFQFCQTIFVQGEYKLLEKK